MQVHPNLPDITLMHLRWLWIYFFRVHPSTTPLPPPPTWVTWLSLVLINLIWTDAYWYISYLELFHFSEIHAAILPNATDGWLPIHQQLTK